MKHVVWAHGRAEAASEAQIYDYDEQGRLLLFKEGLWNAGSQDIEETLEITLTFGPSGRLESVHVGHGFTMHMTE